MVRTINYADSWLMGLDPIATGRQLRRKRLESGRTQEELSETFERYGESASRNTIGCWERGIKCISLAHVVFLSELYHCPIDELVFSYRRSRQRENDGRDQLVPLFAAHFAVWMIARSDLVA